MKLGWSSTRILTVPTACNALMNEMKYIHRYTGSACVIVVVVETLQYVYFYCCWRMCSSEHYKIVYCCHINEKLGFLVLFLSCKIFRNVVNSYNYKLL
jgi:hypothetical protein